MEEARAFDVHLKDPWSVFRSVALQPSDGGLPIL